MMDVDVHDRGPTWIGDRIRELRLERKIQPADLARRAGISRSYLYALEAVDQDDRPVPTATVLYRIARGLGVSVADLVDREPPRIADLSESEIPAGLREAAAAEGLSASDVKHLAALRFRGQQPQSADRWRLLIQQLKLSQQLDGAPDAER